MQQLVDVVPYYLSLGTTELIQAQDLGQRLLRQGLLGDDGGNPIRSFFPLGWIEQNELLDVLQLFEQLLHRDPLPRGLRQLVHRLQQRDSKHAIESMDADFAIRPVVHRSPTQPPSILV